MRTTKVAYFGGAFNPIASHHETIAEAIWDVLGMQTWMAPCDHHRFAKDKDLLAADVRLEMCTLACTGHKHMESSAAEIGFHTNGSTYQTIYELKQKHPDKQFYIVMGMDNANCIDKWDRGDLLIAENPCIVIDRPSCKPQVDWFQKEGHCFLNVGLDEFDPSSTRIRDAIKNKDYAYAEKHLNPAVWNYIRNNNLYGYENANV